MNRARSRTGTVSRISPLKMVFVSDSSSDESYVFPYRVIRGYKGESPRELGLKPGRKVRFSVDADDKVLAAELV